jgi:hypothetical protein
MEFFQMANFCQGSALVLAVAAAMVPALAHAEDGWHGNVTPYLWMAGSEGTVETNPRLPAVNIDTSFSDVWDHLDTAILAKGEITNGKIGVLADFFHIRVAVGKNIKVGNVPVLGAEVGNTTTGGTLAGFYRVKDSENVSIDLLAGARLNVAKIDLDLALPNGPGRTVARDKSWVDPVVGVRGVVRVSKRGSFSGYADVGGFGISSQSVWQVYAGYNHDLNNWATVSAGYRYYSVDYRQDSFVYDLNMAGPLIGLGIRF